MTTNKNSKTNLIAKIISGILALILAACSLAPAENIVTTETQPSLVPNTPTYTATASQTPTVEPTATIEPSPTLVPTKSPEQALAEFKESAEYKQGLEDYLNAMRLEKENVAITEEIKVINGQEYRFLVAMPDLTKLTLVQQKYPNIYRKCPIFVYETNYGWRQVYEKDMFSYHNINSGIAIAGTDYGKPDITKDSIAVDLIKNRFNSVNLSIFEWKYFEQEKGVINQEVDSWIDGLYINWSGSKMTLIGHPLIWPDKNPSWLSTITDKEELSKIIYSRVFSTISKYPLINQWVVVNEPYLQAPQYNYTRPDHFYSILGDEAYKIAFQAAKDANPEVVLILNDTLNHASSGKNSMTTERTKSILKLVDNIDAIGLQMHIEDELPTEEDIIKTLKSYNKPIYVTEMDVDISKFFDNNTRLIKQAEIYQTIIRALIRSEVVKSVHFWAIGDKYSWLELYEGKTNADATLYDDNLKPKAAFYAMLAELYELLDD